MDEFFDRTTAMEEYLFEQPYVVEFIKAFKIEDGVPKYLIKWEGFNDSYNSWEPEECLDLHPREYEWECAIPSSVRRMMRAR
jgi:hypothetical protein